MFQRFQQGTAWLPEMKLENMDGEKEGERERKRVGNNPRDDIT